MPGAVLSERPVETLVLPLTGFSRDLGQIAESLKTHSPYL